MDVEPTVSTELGVLNMLRHQLNYIMAAKMKNRKIA